MLKNIDKWVMSYLKRQLMGLSIKQKKYKKPTNIIFTICDHYEPFWNRVNKNIADERVRKWVNCYPGISKKHFDSFGGHPKHCFFYPIEEYRKNLLEMIGDICKSGYGETEVHLHHDNDNPDSLRSALLDYKELLASEHDLLPRNKESNQVEYGFIHGNWALDNSRPDGRWCGVNNEITILQETGCYADFTMPSAPDITQTKTINSIYYAKDIADKPKSHDTGIEAKAGAINNNGLLCIQGPLCFNPHSRKWGLIPRIENGCLSGDTTISTQRVKLWINQCVHVKDRPDIIFIKLHTHGTQEAIMKQFFDDGFLDRLFSILESHCSSQNINLLYASARQMYNIVKGLEADPKAEPFELLDNKLILAY